MKLINYSDVSVQPKWWKECEICKKPFTSSMIFPGPFCKFCKMSSDIPNHTKICEKCTDKIRSEHYRIHSSVDIA